MSNGAAAAYSVLSKPRDSAANACFGIPGIELDINRK
jgi:hypothetical protein